MNGFSGVLHFDGEHADPAALARAAFRSPLWEPDHFAVKSFGEAGFTCTQRFIAPEDPAGLMPYHDDASGCVVVADSFLVGREELADALDVPASSPDCALILAAWNKWGEDCPRHLAGPFAFLVWDRRRGRLFAAVDHYGVHPFYYAHVPGGKMVVANTMAAFRALWPKLSVNERQFEGFALKCLPPADTCYREVARLPAAHALLADSKGVRVRRYWRLKEESRRLPYRTREEYYGAFRDVFSRAVRDTLRTAHPVVSQISGGLDSSSVTSMAARLLEKEGRGLHAFIAIPLELEGPSFNRGWQYHELPLVQEALEEHPNVDLHVFRTIPDADPVAEHAAFLPLVDHPAQNVMNHHWFYATYRHAIAKGARVALFGEGGNATISWVGYTPRIYLSQWKRFIIDRLKPGPGFPWPQSGFLNKKLMGSLRGRRAARKVWSMFMGFYWLLADEAGTPFYSTGRQMSLWYGVNMLDPTQDIRLVRFCHALPQRIFYREGVRKRTDLDHRLLVREALAGIVPEAIRLNTRRGEQAADWHLQYNACRARWLELLNGLPAGAAEILWRCYDREAIMGLLESTPRIDAPDLNRLLSAGMLLPHALVTADHLGYLLRAASAHPSA